VVVVGAWALRLSGVMGNWTMTWIDLAAIIGMPGIAYTIDYRIGVAPPAFGLPDRRAVALAEPGDDAAVRTSDGMPTPDRVGTADGTSGAPVATTGSSVHGA
jgi:hypothetical protein